MILLKADSKIVELTEPTAKKQQMQNNDNQVRMKAMHDAVKNQSLLNEAGHECYVVVI